MCIRDRGYILTERVNLFHRPQVYPSVGRGAEYRIADDIGIGIADPIVRIEVTETGISTIISVVANEECLLLICLTNTKVKK